MSTSIIEAVSLSKVSTGIYQSNHPPDHHGGNDPRIGYGGWVIAFSINAAAQDIDTKVYNVYSVLGTFLNMSVTAVKMKAHVTTVRNTRTFATRRVDLFQTIKDKDRIVMTMTVDFQRAEPSLLLSYSAPPSQTYAGPDASKTSQDQIRAARIGGIDEAVILDFERRFHCLHQKFERRIAPGAIYDQDLTMMAQKAANLLEPTEITKRRNVEYFRSKSSLICHLDNVLALAFLLDSGMPFIPPIVGGLQYHEIGVAGSIEFALRIFSNDLNVNDWIMKEEKTTVANAGRTFVEANMFDNQGKMIANMTEQCILRPPMKKGAKM